MAQQNINPGSAPILWSTVDEAFNKINTNFTELYLTIGGGGGVVDLTNLSTSVIPNTSGAYDLGSTTKRWRDIYLAGNSIDLGGAIITSPDGIAVNLPTGSTIGGALIRNPAEGNFTYVAVVGQTSIQANSFSDTLNVAAGNSGILLTTTPGTDTLTISNSGVTQLTGTIGQIGVSGDGTGSVTLTNLGVTQLTGTVGQIGVSNSGTGSVTLTNLGVTRLVASTGINISPIGGTGEVTITNSLPAGPTFRNIAVANQLTVEADNTADTLTLVGSGTVSITTNNVTDTITFTGSSTFDLKGSVFGDDSTKIIDAVENKVYGGIFATTLRTEETKIALGASAGSITQGNNATAVGWLAGYNNQGTAAVAFGREAGEINQGQYAVAVGPGAGYTGQGADAIAIGSNAGSTSQPANTIILNASGSAVNGVALQTNSFYVAPIRNVSGANGVVQYDATTKEVSYSSSIGSVSGTFTGNIFTSLIDSSDSSAITVTPITIFSSDVVVENDLNITQRLLLRGSRVINLTELKSVVAASVSFADFQTKIAALV
jgi:hypothetical protein